MHILNTWTTCKYLMKPYKKQSATFRCQLFRLTYFLEDAVGVVLFLLVDLLLKKVLIVEEAGSVRFCKINFLNYKISIIIISSII